MVISASKSYNTNSPNKGEAVGLELIILANRLAN